MWAAENLGALRDITMGLALKYRPTVVQLQPGQDPCSPLPCVVPDALSQCVKIQEGISLSGGNANFKAFQLRR